MPVAAGSYSIVAREVARLTVAFRTPSDLFRDFSIRAAHAAHVIPVIGRSMRSPVPSGVE